jgi:trimethylamine:corrinoid methyltransferase-like protein
MRHRANEIARRILEEHHPKPLDEKQAQELERLAWEMQKKAIPGQ